MAIASLQGTAVAHGVFETHEWAVVIRTLKLSKRERQIVECLMRRCDDEVAIAAALVVSRHTVHTYLNRLYRKLGVSTRCQVLATIFLVYAAAAEMQSPFHAPSSQCDAGIERV